MELSQIVASQPLTPVEPISSLIGIRVMGRGNTERQPIANTLNTRTQALQKVLEKMD